MYDPVKYNLIFLEPKGDAYQSLFIKRANEDNFDRFW